MPTGPADDDPVELRRLMRRARRGDQRAAERLWSSLAPAMRAAVSGAVDPAFADDAAQDAVLRMLEAPRATVRAVASPRAWMCVLAINAARNTARSDARRRSREKVHENARASDRTHQPPQHETDGLVRTADDLDRLRRALHLLDEPDRVLVVLRSVVGLPFAELAAELGLPTSTAADRHRAALDRLRHLLDDRPRANNPPHAPRAPHHERTGP